MTIEICAICGNPREGEHVLVVHGDTYKLCAECADWGYLQLAANPVRDKRWALGRIEGARNAAVWSGRAAKGMRAPADLRLGIYR
jgi:hypothetical protein